MIGPDWILPSLALQPVQRMIFGPPCGRLTYPAHTAHCPGYETATTGIVCKCLMIPCENLSLFSYMASLTTAPSLPRIILSYPFVENTMRGFGATRPEKNVANRHSADSRGGGSPPKLTRGRNQSTSCFRMRVVGRAEEQLGAEHLVRAKHLSQ
jgi:hypothetical protein